MVYILINYNKSFGIKINEYESIYNLKEKIFEITKIDIDDQILYFNGILLDNNKTIIENNIIDNSILYLNKKIIGGIDTFSILMWLIYIVCLLIYFLLLISGILPVIAHSYEYILEWSLKKIGEITKLNNYKVYDIIIWILTFIIRIAISYYFVYALSSFIIFPIVYSLKDKLCPSLTTSNKFGKIIAIVFIIIYAIFNIPDEFLLIFTYLSDISPYLEIIFKPLSGVLQQFADIGKFAPIYAIPFVGTPFLEGYHVAVTTVTTLLKSGIDIVADYNCNNKEQKEKMGKMLINISKNPELRNFISNYHLKILTKILPIGLISNLNNYYKCKTDELPFWEKFSIFKKPGGEFYDFNNFSPSKYYIAEYTTKGFCFALDLIRAISGMIDSIGGSEQIANMIKSGNMAGVGAFIAFIICFILVLFKVI